MSLSLPYDISLDGGVNASHVQANFQAIANKFGALAASDMPSLSLPSSQLTASNVEETIVLSYDGPGRGAVWPAASTTVPVDIIRIGGTATYTVLSADYTLLIPTGGTGAGTSGSLRIDVGTLSGTNFSSSTNLVASTAMTNTSGAGQTVSGSLTLAASTFTAPIHLAVLSTVIGATALPLVRITIRIKRGLQ